MKQTVTVFIADLNDVYLEKTENHKAKEDLE